MSSEVTSKRFSEDDLPVDLLARELLGLYQYRCEREYPRTGGVTSLHMRVPTRGAPRRARDRRVS